MRTIDAWTGTSQQHFPPLLKLDRKHSHIFELTHKIVQVFKTAILPFFLRLIYQVTSLLPGRKVVVHKVPLPPIPQATAKKALEILPVLPKVVQEAAPKLIPEIRPIPLPPPVPLVPAVAVPALRPIPTPLPVPKQLQQLPAPMMQVQQAAPVPKVQQQQPLPPPGQAMQAAAPKVQLQSPPQEQARQALMAPKMPAQQQPPDVPATVIPARPQEIPPPLPSMPLASPEVVPLLPPPPPVQQAAVQQPQPVAVIIVPFRLTPDIQSKVDELKIELGKQKKMVTTLKDAYFPKQATVIQLDQSFQVVYEKGQAFVKLLELQNQHTIEPCKEINGLIAEVAKGREGMEPIIKHGIVIGGGMRFAKSRLSQNQECDLNFDLIKRWGVAIQKVLDMQIKA